MITHARHFLIDLVLSHLFETVRERAARQSLCER